MGIIYVDKEFFEEMVYQILHPLLDFIPEPPDNINIIKKLLEADGVNVEAFWDRIEKLIEKLKIETKGV